MKTTIVLILFSLFQLLGYAQVKRTYRYDVLSVQQKSCIIFVGNSIADDCEWSELFENCLSDSNRIIRR